MQRSDQRFCAQFFQLLYQKAAAEGIIPHKNLSHHQDNRFPLPINKLNFLELIGCFS